MDTLRNALRAFTDMDLVTVKNTGILHVRDPNKLLQVAESVDYFRTQLVVTSTFYIIDVYFDVL